jgi:hypothetical protein
MTRPDDALLAEVLDRLNAGAGPAQVCRDLSLDPAGCAAALGRAALGSDDPADWPALTQSRPRRPWLAPALGPEACAELFPGAAQPARLALAAGLLQIHDFWDASHQAAQQADDLGERAFSAYWHGIAHRREPDAGNATYWFRRVGRHPLFGRLIQEARPLLEAHQAELPPALSKSTTAWDPFAIIDLCTSARAGSARAALALELQRLEMSLLLEATVEGVTSGRGAGS